MKVVTVNCDKCNKDFYIKKSNIKKKFIDKVKVEYFKCKHCQEMYITICTDDYVKDKKAELRKLEQEIMALAMKVTLSCTEDNLKKMEKVILEKDELKVHLKKYIDDLKIEIKDKI